MDDQSSKSLKITLGILLVVVLGTLAFVVLRGRNTVTSQVVETANVAPVENKQPTDVVTPTAPPVSGQTLDKLKELQGLIDAGKITPEEASKQMEEFNAKSQPTPAETQK